MIGERERNRGERWQREFPYRNDSDSAITRRDFLRVAVLTSAALFTGTVVLAVLGRIDERRRGNPMPIASVGEVPEREALYFRYPTEDDRAVMIRRGEGFAAYSQKCTHLSCGVFFEPDNDRFFCPCHDGAFAAETGEPIAGPPQRRLPRINLEIRDGTIWAIEEVP